MYIGGIYMNENDINNLMNQFNQMLQNNDIPGDLKNIVDNLKNSSNSNNNSDNNNSTSSPDIDINTILKMKQVMDSMNSNKDDPRTNLLLSLKPYLKESRKQKVDQYIKLFGLGKALETFNILGNDNNPGGDKHDAK